MAARLINDGRGVPYVSITGDTLEGKFSTEASINLMGYNDVWVDGEIILYGSERWVEIMSSSSDACDGEHVTKFAKPPYFHLSPFTPDTICMPPYKDLRKMRRLYQVFAIDLRTDEIDEFQCIATSDRSAELKAIAAQGIIDDVDNYQIVVRALANVAERIEADNES